MYAFGKPKAVFSQTSLAPSDEHSGPLQPPLGLYFVSPITRTSHAAASTDRHGPGGEWEHTQGSFLCRSLLTLVDAARRWCRSSCVHQEMPFVRP
jgi:hypothetical protein